ncbi:MAG: hypothetical protein AAFV98_07860 [Chloroflexota bacterium]
MVVIFSHHEDMEDTKMKTIFKRPDVHELYCQIWNYSPSLGPVMRIRIHTGGAATLYWLDFIGVGYFSGATLWQGAHVLEAPKERFNSLMAELSIPLTYIEHLQPVLYHIPARRGSNPELTTTVEIMALKHQIIKGDMFN